MTKYTNEEAVELYLMEISDKADRTKENYLKHIYECLDYLNNKSVHDIEYIDLQRFIKSEMDKGNTIATTNKKTSALNSFFGYCERSAINERRLHLSTKKDKEKSQRDSETIRISSEMYEQIIEANENYFNHKSKHSMRDVRDNILLYLFLYGGLRRTEIRNLRLKDISKFEREEEIRLKIDIVRSKRDKSRTIYLSKKCYMAMENWLKTRLKRGYKSEYVFCTESDKQMDKNESTLPKIAEKLSKRAGLFNEYGEEILFSPHAYRHGCGSMLAKKGISTIEIAKYLGDTLQVIERTYIHKDTSASLDIADCLL